MIKTFKNVINYNNDDENKETKQEKIQNQHKLLFDEIKIRKNHQKINQKKLINFSQKISKIHLMIVLEKFFIH